MSVVQFASTDVFEYFYLFCSVKFFLFENVNISGYLR
jgi:hypothetical protein